MRDKAAIPPESRFRFSQKTMNNTKSHQSNDYLVDLLHGMKMPGASANVVADLKSMPGIGFEQMVNDAADGNFDAIRKVKGIFYNLMPVAKERLLRRGVTALDWDLLVHIGIKEGNKFATALKDWDESNDEACDQARFVRLAIANAKTALRGKPSSQSLSPDGRGFDGPPSDQVDNVVSFGKSNDMESGNRPSASSQSRSSESTLLPFSHHVYGGKSAACWTSCTSRNDDPDRKEDFHTVMLQGATLVPGATRSYDWEKKIIIQLSSRELPLVLGVGALQS